MTTVTVKIWDDGETLQMEGALDNPNAINEPPTVALIVGSYLAANTEAVVKNAMHWFKDMQMQSVDEAEVAKPTQSIILPDDGVVGAPV
jgi:hypothetical protein